MPCHTCYLIFFRHFTEWQIFFIIGQFDHVDAITAVSNGSQVMHMLTVIIVGLAMGATVTISRAVGADRKLDAARAIGNTVHIIHGCFHFFYAPASSPRQAHCCTDRYPDRSGDRYHTISYHLFLSEFPLLQLIT